MIQLVQGNIFDSTCEVLVNPVNCKGVMGKGLALQFKKRYPKMFERYKDLCSKGVLKVGKPRFYFGEGADHIIMNFPTKNDWRDPSRLEWIDQGLVWFADVWRYFPVRSIAFPALGCGCGELDWETVKNLFYEKLSEIPIPIELYAPMREGE